MKSWSRNYRLKPAANLLVRPHRLYQVVVAAYCYGCLDVPWSVCCLQTIRRERRAAVCAPRTCLRVRHSSKPAAAQWPRTCLRARHWPTAPTQATLVRRWLTRRPINATVCRPPPPAPTPPTNSSRCCRWRLPGSTRHSPNSSRRTVRWFVKNAWEFYYRESLCRSANPTKAGAACFFLKSIAQFAPFTSRPRPFYWAIGLTRPAF